MDHIDIMNKIINDWKVLTAPTCNCKNYKDVRGRCQPETCNCKNYKDVRGRCQPEDATFKACRARVDTAIWYIENCGKSLEDFLFLGPKIQYLIRRLMEEEI